MKFPILNSRWPALFWTVLIFVLLTIPVDNLQKGSFLNIPHFDKIIHIILFGILVFLWARRYSSFTNPEELKKLILWIFMLSCGYGIAMEFYQEYFTERSFDSGDILADIAGSGISSLSCWYYYKKR